MIQTMLGISASVIILTIGPATFYTIALGLVATVLVVLGTSGWIIAKDRIEGTRTRNWPTVPAVIDIVSVAYCGPDGISRNSSYYQATLTYTYRYPEEQMGDFSRSFGQKEDAEAWANSYKGETIKIRVDPSDPTHSVLREEDL